MTVLINLRKHYWPLLLVGAGLLFPSTSLPALADDVLHGLNDVSVTVVADAAIQSELNRLLREKLASINLTIKSDSLASIEMNYDGSQLHLVVRENATLPSNRTIMRPVVLWEKAEPAQSDQASMTISASDLLDKFSLEYLKANLSHTDSMANKAPYSDMVGGRFAAAVPVVAPSADPMDSGSTPESIAAKRQSWQASTDAYVADANKRIREFLRGNTYTALRTTHVRFVLWPSGAIVKDNVSIDNSSGVQAFDEAIVKAVKAAAPFLPGGPDRQCEVNVAVGSNVPVVRDHSNDPAIDFGPYMASIQRQLRGNWLPPRGQESEHVQVVFRLRSDGTVIEPRVSKSCGVNAYDDAAMHAVNASGKLPPLPEGSPDYVDIQFNYDYNVHNLHKH